MLGNSVECTGTLYDKESGKAVWQHKVVKDEGGALGAVLTVGVLGAATWAMIHANQDTLNRIFFSDLIAAQFPTENGYCVFCI